MVKINFSQAEEWTRHYDTLFWQITSILIIAIGGLFTFAYSQKDTLINLVGLIFTGASFYVAASFRERRHFWSNQKNNSIQKEKDDPNSLQQWFPYCLIFWIIGLLWITLILKTLKGPYTLESFLISLILWTAYVLFFSLKKGVK